MTTARRQLVFALTAALIASGCASGDGDTAKVSRPAEERPKLHYAYDPLGRLVQAVAADGTAVQYSYDAVGNITAIRRLVDGALRIIDFMPPAGTIGNTVAIYGFGFSTTPSENNVTFNGTAATITAATPTALTVSVPSGATTGKISVVVGNGSATSSTDYMVLPSSGAPGIASFTPMVGPSGTVVSVTGINFQTRVVDDKVLVGGQLADVIKDATSPTGTLLKFSVPSSTASGKIEVTTPFGVVLSC
jgi:YD repeat-containing protein